MDSINYAYSCTRQYLDLIIRTINNAHYDYSLDGIITAVSTLIAGAIASLITYFSFKNSEKRMKRSELIQMLDTLLQTSMKWPYLEDTQFIKHWSPQKHDEKSCRYDNYCCMVFNFLERLWKLFKGNEEDMIDIVGYEEYILQHSNWWIVNSEYNEKYYDKKFCIFVNNTLTKI